jgi:hypothetical protein
VRRSSGKEMCMSSSAASDPCSRSDDETKISSDVVRQAPEEEEVCVSKSEISDSTSLDKNEINGQNHGRIDDTGQMNGQIYGQISGQISDQRHVLRRDGHTHVAGELDAQHDTCNISATLDDICNISATQQNACKNNENDSEPPAHTVSKTGAGSFVPSRPIPISGTHWSNCDTDQCLSNSIYGSGVPGSVSGTPLSNYLTHVNTFSSGTGTPVSTYSNNMNMFASVSGTPCSTYLDDMFTRDPVTVTSSCSYAGNTPLTLSVSGTPVSSYLTEECIMSKPSSGNTVHIPAKTTRTSANGIEVSPDGTNMSPNAVHASENAVNASENAVHAFPNAVHTSENAARTSENAVHAPENAAENGKALSNGTRPYTAGMDTVKTPSANSQEARDASSDHRARSDSEDDKNETDTVKTPSANSQRPSELSPAKHFGGSAAVAGSSPLAAENKSVSPGSQKPGQNLLTLKERLAALKRNVSQDKAT